MVFKILIRVIFIVPGLHLLSRNCLELIFLSTNYSTLFCLKQDIALENWLWYGLSC
jgi:hypothetical protein